MTLAWMNLTGLRTLLERRELSSAELVDALLARIDRLDGTLHAFTEVHGTQARALARAADQARAAGVPLGPLHGLPVVLKDLLDVEGQVCTLGSAHFRERRSTVTSAAVERLLQAGMVPLGKLHMTEFAFGGWGTNAVMGTPRNPWDLGTHRAPGGSSSGTGVAVAAGCAPVGLGSDTGGSIRIPSGFNGLTGLKVTYGRVSLHGAGLLSWTLDSIGPMARCVRDCALVLDAIAGPDPRDPATLSQPLERYAREPRSVRGLRIAMPPRDQLPSFMDPGVTQAWEDAARTFGSLGVDVEPVRLPAWYFDLAASTGCVIASEAYSLHRAYVADPTAPLDPAVRGRLRTAESLAPAAYAEALRTMGVLRRQMADWFESFDAVLLPTVAIPAPALPDVDEASPIPGYLTRPANFLGLCGLSQPAGFVRGLPVGIQLVGKPWAERTVLSLGQAFESATTHHAVRPDLGALGVAD